jgi:hypothetical protein
VVRDLEGDVTEGAVEKREKILREKIKDIIPCDASKSDSFFDTDHEKCQYDIVQSNGCFEVVLNSPEAYREGIVKLASYVKPGGHLQLLTSAGGEGGYSFAGVTDIKLYVLNVDPKDGIKGLEMAGEKAIELVYLTIAMYLSYSAGLTVLETFNIHRVDTTRSLQFTVAQKKHN